ncbi:MAG TPA: SGNH/GDSL hydrolase family protein [Geminicoccaceae bacterium]|nr:SGNH/GDSL hydrolase family protein [Geminicoccaceae bacterium]
MTGAAARAEAVRARGRLKGLLVNLVLLGASLLLAVGAVEAAFRLFPQLATEEVALRMHWREVQDARGPASERATVPDPKIGFLYRPNYRGEIRRNELGFGYTTDANGFRNPTPVEPPADIVILGDSMAFGYGVEDDQTWSALLARARPELSIVNLGMIGAGPQQYQRIYERFGAPLRPRLVLFTLFPGNDVFDANLFDRWRREGGGRTFAEWRYESPDRGLRGLLESWLDGSYVYQLLRDARRRLATPFAGRTLSLADGQQVRLAPAVYASNVARSDPAHLDFRLVMAAVEATRREVEAAGAKFMVLLVPTKELVYLPLVGESAPDPLPAFAAELERQGISFLDLTPPLQTEALERAVYFEVDGHPNALGYRIIADAVLARLGADFAAGRDPPGLAQEAPAGPQ